MNVALTVIFVLGIATAFTRTEAFPSWSPGGKDKHKHWSHHHFETCCTVGHCVKAWKCPKSALATETVKDSSCIDRENGPWVCCLIYDDGYHHWVDANTYTSEAPNSFRRTTIKVNAISSTEKHWYGARKPLFNDFKNRNEEEELPHIRTSGDVLKNDREKYPFYRPINKTIATKIPNGVVVSKSTVRTDYKRTTNLWDKRLTSTTSPNYYKRTTNMWDKPRTSTTNPNYYKRTTNMWDKPRTSTTSPNYYKRTTNIWDKPRISTTSPNYYKRTTNVWDKPRASTTSPNYYKRTTNVWDKPRTSTSSTNYYKKTTNLWDKSHTSESRIIFPTERATKYITSSPPTKRISNNGSTKRPWTRSISTTKAAWEYTTAYTKRTISTTTNHPYFKKSTASTKVSTQRRNQTLGSSATVNSARAKPTKRSSTSFTTKSTRRYSVTTPLPNVNIHSCGIGNERTIIRRQTRDSNNGRNPDVDIVYSSNSRPRGRLPYQRIVGGEEAEPFSWPWVAALYKVTSSGGNRFLSAGTLINEDFILTAAHVFTPEDLRTASYVVMLGTHDAQDAVAQYIVSSVLVHPNYEHRYYYNDIALLKLERKVLFSDYINPVCLPSPTAPLNSDKDLIGKNVTVMGWGDDSFGGKSSQVLKEASFPILSRASCNASYVRVASNRFPKGITANMLCAGDPRGGKDACQGDSGGPLTVIENGRYTQVGIVSFGYKCGDKEFPGVYTKVAPYLSWIAENTRYADDSRDYEYY